MVKKKLEENATAKTATKKKKKAVDPKITLLNLITAEIEIFQENAATYMEKGNKTAGARSRKASLNLTKTFKEWRKATVG